MTITLGQRSLERLQGVHPDLVRVVKRAAADAGPGEDFTVLEGVRSREQMAINWGKGRSAKECISAGVPVTCAQPQLPKVTWLKNPYNSPHRVAEDGFGHAVDLAPFPIDWNDLTRFDKLAKLILAAAAKENVAVTWGADWDRDGKPRERGETDSPHFQIA